MRSNEERVNAVKKRIAEIEKQKKQCLSRIIIISFMAVCFALIAVFLIL